MQHNWRREGRDADSSGQSSLLN
ncbi:Transposon Tf2-9 polyprotein, partial [Araneus ventricosus]